ncbi:MAG: hypothetical protein ACI4J0_10950 [Huintestinicola sp.]|uniref:hypothetical protein n=1 Tax=Huintestinicola sp. TaxID=2981661 RepID=UPI003EFF4001
MGNTMKKMGISMSMLMGVTMSFVLSLVGTLGGGHFTVPGWIRSFIVSLIISLVLGFIIPMKKLSDSACAKCNVPIHSTKGKLLSALVSDLIYTPLLTVIMVTLAVTGAGRAIDAQISENNALLTETQSSITALTEELNEAAAALETCLPEESGELNAKVGELNGKIGELNGKVQQLNGEIQGMTAAKPHLIPVLIRSLILTLIVGYAVIYIIQPIYLNMLMKKFGLTD